MSNNWFTFVIFIWVAGAILEGVFLGTSGLVSTNLTATLQDTDTTMTVASTDGFNTAGVVLVESEWVCYTGKTGTSFTGLSRGPECRRDNQASRHSSGAIVGSEAPGILNTFVGFDIVSAFGEGGLIGIVKGMFFTIAHLPQFLMAVVRVITWDFTFLDGPYAYIRYVILFLMSASLVMGFVRLARGG